MGNALKTGGGRSEFEESPVDFTEVTKAYHTDGYIRRALDKHCELIYKNGWEINSKNDAATEYVWTRFKLMFEASGQSIDSVLNEVRDDLVKYGNAYLVKARAKQGQLAQGINAVGYTGKQPIAAYFALPAAQMQVARDDNGVIKNYQQIDEEGGGEGVSFKPEDIVHFHYKRPTGRAYGVPIVYNVLDDIKLLRQIEENVARLIYRNLFPLYLYQVGLPQPGFEAEDEEIEFLQQEIGNLPADGALVVPERHNVKVVGSEGQAIDANGYLKYFRERVFSGLNMSDSTMGISGTANKSTSDNQNADLNDTIKDIQKSLQDTLKYEILNELLFEGGFDPILNVDDEVDFIFHEIEFDAKIKRENHVVQLFLNNIVTFEEMRNLMGMETSADEGRLYANLFGGGGTNEGAANASETKDKPENQFVKKDNPGKPNRSAEVKESLIEESHSIASKIESHVSKQLLILNDLEETLLENASKTLSVSSLVILKDSILKKSNVFSYELAIEGAVQANKDMGVNKEVKDVQAFRPKLSFIDTLERIAKENSHITYGQLNSLRVKMKMQLRDEFYTAYNVSYAAACKREGKRRLYVECNGDCPKCKDKETIRIQGENWMEQIPPFHPNCMCTVQYKK
ncbi:MAG: phage portal protein [Bacilli bacterium]